MARKTEQGGGKPDEAPHDRAPGIETRIAQAGDELPAIVPPGDRFGDSVHLWRIEPERFPDVAQRALGLISDERGRERSALTAVFVIDVLDDFLAPLMLEIDVDIGRLVALLRDEALEQKLLLGRIYLGDIQGVADGGIGRRAAPLAENAPAAGVADDVVDGQEKRLVAKLGDERKLALHEIADFLRRSGGEAPPQSFFGQPAPPARRGFPLGGEVLRLPVTPALPG